MRRNPERTPGQVLAGWVIMIAIVLGFIQAIMEIVRLILTILCVLAGLAAGGVLVIWLVERALRRWRRAPGTRNDNDPTGWRR